MRKYFLEYKLITLTTRNNYMENKKALSFVFGIIAIILGITLFKQFDFQNFRFEKPALAGVYLTTFMGSIFFLIKNAKK
ncbi:hypothetical protein PF438_11425 [Elizabethkingia meningoseptica]|uniref:hypothetical protein n=1 Tax=Elizabethkingia meningoseptica TaxID=238 RepID=UPI0022F158FC|nr:hypothetical protein [Elizabethkingia meningoseptica]WBS73505.1 hypothetical protein PF438_11425 [Elizabethkingia meningoseptica]